MSSRFGEEYRPVHIDTHVLGYPRLKSDFLFDRNLNFKLCDIVARFAEKKPTLIFCSSRKGAAQAAQQLAKDCDARLLVRSPEHAALLERSARQAEDVSLANCIRNGVGFHTAGVSSRDRDLVERLFLSESLLCLCTTSTCLLSSCSACMFTQWHFSSHLISSLTRTRTYAQQWHKE